MDKRIKTQIEELLQENIESGGRGGRISTVGGKEYFLKSGLPSRTYACEANGLNELAKSGTIKTAEVKAVTETFILTEYIQSYSPSRDFFITFGRELARLHKFKGNEFGFYEDNFIGANEQINSTDGIENHSWPAFYFNKRLLFQYRLIEKNGYASTKLKSAFKKLEDKIDLILEDSDEQPCLLHGDLWNGNFLCNKESQAVLIDPAVYYGHREADLAMTKLFGGFPASFYEAYQEEYPLSEGWEYREKLYKLYHVMNHLNLFGRAYLQETEQIIDYYVNS